MCEALLEDLETAFGSEVYEVRRVDVDSDAGLRERWGLLIPVLLDESGRPLSVTRLDIAAVAAALGRAPRQRMGSKEGRRDEGGLFAD